MAWYRNSAQSKMSYSRHLLRALGMVVGWGRRCRRPCPGRIRPRPPSRPAATPAVAVFLLLGQLFLCLNPVTAQGSVASRLFIGARPSQLTNNARVGTIAPYPSEYECECPYCP